MKKIRVANAQGFNPSTRPAMMTVSGPRARNRSTSPASPVSGLKSAQTLGAPVAAYFSTSAWRFWGVISFSPMRASSPMKRAGVWRSVRPARSASHWASAACS
jgi:hypothetical protein